MPLPILSSCSFCITPSGAPSSILPKPLYLHPGPKHHPAIPNFPVFKPLPTWYYLASKILSHAKTLPSPNSCQPKHFPVSNAFFAPPRHISPCSSIPHAPVFSTHVEMCIASSMRLGEASVEAIPHQLFLNPTNGTTS